MLVLTVAREAHTLGRLAHLEPKLMRFGAVIQNWDATSVKIAVPDEKVIHVGMLLSENYFQVRA